MSKIYRTKNDNNLFKKLRVNTNLGQDEVAKILNINRSTVSKWECGSTIPDQALLPKLADLYGVSTDYLLGRTEINEPLPMKRPNYVLSEKFLQDYAELLKDKSFIETTKLYNEISPELRAMALGYIVGLLRSYNIDTKKILGY